MASWQQTVLWFAVCSASIMSQEVAILATLCPCIAATIKPPEGSNICCQSVFIVNLGNCRLALNSSPFFSFFAHHSNIIEPNIFYMFSLYSRCLRCSSRLRHATISWGKSVFFQWKSVTIRILILCIDMHSENVHAIHIATPLYRDAVYKKNRDIVRPT